IAEVRIVTLLTDSQILDKQYHYKESFSNKTLELIINTLNSLKTSDIQVLNLKGKSDMADYMVIATGTSSRNVGAIADKIVESLKHNNFEFGSVEGREECNWVLIDAFDVIVHIFKPDVREFYNLDKMWAMEMIHDE
ncbi:MAG: ribosome silencing factor, partial [Pseudomonadota bacterium]